MRAHKHSHQIDLNLKSAVKLRGDCKVSRYCTKFSRRTNEYCPMRRRSLLKRIHHKYLITLMSDSRNVLVSITQYPDYAFNTIERVHFLLSLAIINRRVRPREYVLRTCCESATYKSICPLCRPL